MDRDGPCTDSLSHPTPRACSLCAISLRAIRSEPSSSYTPEHVGRLIKQDPPYITGPVIWLDSFGTLKVATKPGIDLDQPLPFVIEKRVSDMLGNSEFVVHESCWNFIVYLIPSKFTEPEIARALHRFFMATLTKVFPTVLSYVYARSIPGARGSCNREHIDHKSPFSNLNSLFQPRDLSRPEYDRKVLRQIANPTDPFIRLPMELLTGLSEYLSIYSFCNLRLASRSFALVTDYWALHRGFWYSRFATGGEWSVFSLSESYLQSLDTESLRYAHHVVSSAMAKKDSRVGQWLAKMHWEREMLHAVSHTVHALIRSPESPYDGELETGRHYTNLDVGMACNSKWDTSRRMRNAEFVELTLRIVPPNPTPSAATHIEAFFLPFFGANMLCGMRVTHSDDIPHEIGNVNTVLSSKVTIPPNGRIKRVEVSATQEGVLALYIRVEGTPGYLTLSAGRPLDMYKGVIGWAVLKVPEESTVRGIHLQFDPIKCNAVRLLLDPHPEPRAYHEHLWHGKPPRIDRFTMKNFVRSAASMWCYHMNFGGRHGEKLAKLSSISTITDPVTGALHGMCFRYADEQDVVYGGMPCWAHHGCLQSTLELKESLISGLQGERVTEFTFKIGRSLLGLPTTGRTYEYICHLTAVTNFQRTLNLQSRDYTARVAMLRGGCIASSRIQRIVALNAGTTLVGGPFQILEAETMPLAEATPRQAVGNAESGSGGMNSR